MLRVGRPSCRLAQVHRPLFAAVRMAGESDRIAAMHRRAVRPGPAAELGAAVVGHGLRDLGLRMIMIDEVHNLLAGTHREQRRFLNVLRYLSNELEASLVCLGVSEAVDAIRGDVQLARRLDEHHLPNWRDDAEFSDMIQTLIAAMPLQKKSNLRVKSLKQMLALTGGVTSRIFALVKDLSIDAIRSGEECITDDVITKWTPVWSRHAPVQRRLEKSGA